MYNKIVLTDILEAMAEIIRSKTIATNSFIIVGLKKCNIKYFLSLKA